MKTKLACMCVLILLTCFLSTVPISATEPSFIFKKDKTAITLFNGQDPVWQYNFAMITHVNVPKKDPRIQAGCYFHPVYGLNSEILTDNAPKDHYHHHGIFWTWPHVILHEKNGTNRELDLWTSNTPIRQYFVRWLKQEVTEDHAVFAVENGWFIDKVILDDAGNVVSGEKVMKETVQVTTGPKVVCQGMSSRFLDFEFTWTPIGRDISLRGAENKSYGGFSIRFCPPGPKSPQTVITTPDGIARDDLPEKPMPWADFTSTFIDHSDQKSGAAILIPKDHPDYPPTWLARHYGPMCVGWPGVISKKFEQNKTIKLRYRVWIHEGLPAKEQLEKVWRDYLDGNVK